MLYPNPNTITQGQIDADDFISLSSKNQAQSNDLTLVDKSIISEINKQIQVEPPKLD